MATLVTLATCDGLAAHGTRRTSCCVRCVELVEKISRTDCSAASAINAEAAIPAKEGRRR